MPPEDRDARAVLGLKDELSAAMKPSPERSCYACAHYALCLLRQEIWDALQGNRMLNIDSDSAPGRMSDVLTALASACTEYEYREER